MSVQETRMFDGSDTVVLYDELAVQDILPLAWRVLPQAADPDAAASFMERNARAICLTIRNRSSSPTENRRCPSLAIRLALSIPPRRRSWPCCLFQTRSELLIR